MSTERKLDTNYAGMKTEPRLNDADYTCVKVIDASLVMLKNEELDPAGMKEMSPGMHFPNEEVQELSSNPRRDPPALLGTYQSTTALITADVEQPLCREKKETEAACHSNVKTKKAGPSFCEWVLLTWCIAATGLVVMFAIGILNPLDMNNGESVDVNSTAENLNDGTQLSPSEGPRFPSPSGGAVPTNPGPHNNPAPAPGGPSTVTTLPTVGEETPCPSCSTTRCGVDWIDANNHCNKSLCVAWPNVGWDTCTCPEGEGCFADLNSDCCTTEQPAPCPSCSTNRCGTDWLDAENSCKSVCVAWPNAGWDSCTCPDGEECFADLTSDCCSGPSSPSNAPTISNSGPPSCSGNSTIELRCGIDWADANSNCKTLCAVAPEPGWDACPDNEACYSALDPIPCCS